MKLTKPCPRNHPLEARYTRVDKTGYTHLLCRDCQRENGRKHYHEVLRAKVLKPRVIRAATSRPTLVDIGWAAGLYEGEGNCQWIGTERARITQKERWILDRCVKLFGGRVAIHKYRKLNREYHTWNIDGPRARGFLQTVYPLLSPHRQKQVKAVLLAGRREGRRRYRLSLVS